MSDIAPSEVKIQAESVQFNQPASEASQFAIGGLANALREIIMPVGSIIYSMLDETTFQAQNTDPSPARWILADGRDVTGSKYASLVASTVPDLRGVFLRGKNYGRSTGSGDPSGDLPVGHYEGDVFKSHNHAINDPSHTHIVNDPGHSHLYNGGGNHAGIGPTTAGNNTNLVPTSIETTGVNLQTALTGITILNTGSAETAPRAVVVNAFIRIN